MLRKGLLFFLLLISVFALHAAPIALQINAPANYVVQASDTQWDLANKYLKNPWQWTSLWEAPTASSTLPPIYVGDTLILTTDKNGAHLIVNHGKNLNSSSAAISPVPLKPLMGFLNKSSCMTPDEFGQLPYVVSLAKGLSAADQGDVVLARGLLNPSLNQHYWILHKKRLYIEPNDTNKILGVEADYIATANLTKLGEPSNLQLTQVDQLVRIGDRLQTSQTTAPVLQFNLQAAGKLGKIVRAQIIANLIDYASINKYSIVALNYGAEEGAVPGQILLITSDLSTKKPIGKQIGSLVIFRTFPQVSWAMVMQMSAQIQTLNGVQSPTN